MLRPLVRLVLLVTITEEAMTRPPPNPKKNDSKTSKDEQNQHPKGPITTEDVSARPPPNPKNQPNTTKMSNISSDGAHNHRGGEAEASPSYEQRATTSQDEQKQHPKGLRPKAATVCCG